MDVGRAEVVDQAREQVEHARVARDTHPAGSEHVPELIVPEILGQATRQPQPAHVPCGQILHSAERVKRLPELRHTGRVALTEPCRQPVEEQVDRAWRLMCRRRRLSGLGGVADIRFVAEATRKKRRRHRLEMGLASHRGVERFEAPGGIAVTAPEPRRRGCGRKRPLRATGLTARAAARRAGQARRWPATRASRLLRRHRAWPAQQRGRACLSPPDRASAPPPAPGTPPRRRRRHGTGPCRQSAPAQRRPPGPHPPLHERDATPCDRRR